MARSCGSCWRRPVASAARSGRVRPAIWACVFRRFQFPSSTQDTFRPFSTSRDAAKLRRELQNEETAGPENDFRSCGTLEQELQCKLNLPRRARVLDLSKIRAVADAAIGIQELR